MNDPKHFISLSSLVLARLLPRGRKGETPGKIRDDLQQLAGRTQGKAEFLQSVKVQLEQLQSRELVERVSSRGSACSLTPAGRKKTCAFLGIEKVPGRITWATVRDIYLFAKALGIEPAYLKKRGLDGVRAVVLARMLDLPWRPSSTLTSVMDTCLARHYELAIKPQYSLRPEIVARAVTIGEQSAEEISEQRFDLESFANDVLSAASACRTGWFGEDKVFISHVWQAYAEHPERMVREMEAFKSRLVEAHRRDLLTLVRADLVEVMDSRDVAASETAYLNATFHFVRCRRSE